MVKFRNMNKNLIYIFLLFFLVSNCGTSKSTTSATNTTNDEKNRGTVTLLDQIRKLPGVIVRNNVPLVNKAANSFAGSPGTKEPLYVLNSYPVGNSFRSLNQLVDNFNVKKIELLTGPDAAVYGSRGANGVIVITTYK